MAVQEPGPGSFEQRRWPARAGGSEQKQGEKDSTADAARLKQEQKKALDRAACALALSRGCVSVESVLEKPCMTEIDLHFRFAHYGLYGNAPVDGGGAQICNGRARFLMCVSGGSRTWHRYWGSGPHGTRLFRRPA